MAKVLRDVEMAEIINQAVNGNAIDCGDAYLHFLEDLGELIAKHFGGEFRGVDYNDAIGSDGKELGYVGVFRINDSVPADGWVYSQYDPTVVWKDGKETQP